ncbi:autotransporter protein [Yersinia intermedia]|uniref:Autotransporter protein n=1 Tax=Yersinia intermedia TaxID=631 RepID=A0A0H5LVL9_YERIN|nr:autotransporter outer membrane beta-barrel domain-containing protein [Yersinia intermedia]CRY55198.1 autotransporter protein [Yersinia intermedia]
MNHRNTLNTRLLPLSILISSLVSGGAVAAPMIKFDESQYTPVTAGAQVTDDTKWSFQQKDKVDKIEQQILDLTSAKTEANDKLAKDKTYTEHETTLASLANAKDDKNDADAAVMSGASKVISSTEKLVVKNEGKIEAGTKGEKEKAVVGDDSSDADKKVLTPLIADVRAKQEAYHDALAAAKTKVASDATTVTSTDSVFTNVDTSKKTFEQAVEALETTKLKDNKTLKAYYPSQLDEFKKEIKFTENAGKLEKAHQEIEAFKALIVKKDDAVKDFNKFETAKTYLGDPNNAKDKLTPDSKDAYQDVSNSVDGAIALLTTQKGALTPTQGVAAIATGELARNEIVDTDDQTIATGGASLGNQIIGKIQTVAKDAVAKDSTISGTGGKQVLEAGAQSIGTIVNDLAVLENKGGDDYVSVINSGGMLSLAGADKDNLAKSVGAKVLEGGNVTVGEFAQINSLSSTKGKIELKTGAVAVNTTIDGGSLTIEAGAEAKNTHLLDTNLDLVEGAKADGTFIGDNSTFTIKSNAKASATTLVGPNSQFIVEDGAKATLSRLYDGTMTVKSGAIAVNTVLSGLEGSELILESGAKANNTEVHGMGHGFTIHSGAEAVNTQLSFAKLILEKGAKADGTTLLDGSSFTLLDGAETKDTHVAYGVFTLEKNATANTTTLQYGEFIVKEGATANNSTVNSGQFNLVGTAENTTLNNGKFNVAGGATANNTTVKGGKFSVMDRARAMKLELENGIAMIAGQLEDATLNGGSAIFDKTAEISGTIDSKANSVISVYEGAKTADADLNLGGNLRLIGANAPQSAFHRAAMINPAQFAFKNVTLNGGTIDMSSTNTQLTMASLAGNGNFTLASSLYNQANAPLNVLGNANGTFDIQIKDNGVAPTNLKLISVQGANNARFTLGNGAVNLGNYLHTLVSDGQGGFKLVADLAVLTPSTAGVLAVANTLPVIFNAELSSIQNRLDKQSTSGNKSGVWVNYLNDNFKISGTAANFDQKLSGMTFGGDKAIEIGDSVLSVGGFGSYSNSDIKSDYQSSGSVKSNSLGAYAQYLTDNGYYLNGVLKANQFKQKLDIVSHSHSASGHANVSGLGIAVKVGKHINLDAAYISPYVAMSTFTSGKSSSELSNGMKIDNKGSSNTTGTIGMTTGYRFVLNNGAEIKPYALLSFDQDLKASNDVMINNEMFDNSRKGTRINAGLGANVNVTKNLSVGSEVKVSKGKNVDTPVTINLGVAYTF